MPTKAIVFYDGACPLCSKEIAHYRKCSGAENIDWLDISSSREKLQLYNIRYEDAMRRFHVLAANDELHIGAYGFAYLWSQLKPYRLLSTFVTRLKLLKPLNWFYLKFADWRIRDKCSEGCRL